MGSSPPPCATGIKAITEQPSRKLISWCSSKRGDKGSTILPENHPVTRLESHIKSSQVWLLSQHLRCWLLHQASPGRRFYCLRSSRAATSAYTRFYRIVAAYCDRSRRHPVSCCGSQFGFLLLCETIKAPELAFSPLFPARLFSFHGYLAPFSSAKCKSEAEDGL